MSETGFEQQLCIEATHPALPGHFPGQPLVPGVMLLEQVAIALRQWRGQRLARVLEAKFMTPLLPNQQASLHLTSVDSATASTRIRFEIRWQGILLARGLIEGST